MHPWKRRIQRGEHYSIYIGIATAVLEVRREV